MPPGLILPLYSSPDCPASAWRWFGPGSSFRCSVPVVYCFATILAVYLLATALGSEDLPRCGCGFEPHRNPRYLAGCFALLPLPVADPRIPVRHQLFSPAVRISYGIGAFCAVWDS